jgi:uncharacterized membrane protein YphA (DoxX/SURF4 family)
MKIHLKALLRTLMVVCSNTAIIVGIILICFGGLTSITAFGMWVYDACNRVPFHWNWLEFLGYGLVFTMPVLFMVGALYMVFREEYRKQLNDLKYRR